MGEKRYYMACIDLDGRRCLVVGGGTVGLEKAKGLLECGAIVTVVSPEIEPELQLLPVRWRRKQYDSGDLDGNFLVVAATPDRPVNRRVFEDAEARSLLCNVVDDAELCSFILPAVYRRDPIALAVSTGGASPALAKRLRDELGEQIDERHVELAYRLRELRPWVRAHFASYGGAPRFLRLAGLGVARVTVWLVGAGPGDPGLITARGLELVRRCEVLVYDRLVAEELVGEAPADAILVPRDAHEQAEINELLVRLARQGYDVVRLKGGDPFVFGRGGEEALALAEAGLEFEVVPGVSSISAVPASAGIPVTHRGLSSQVTIASGHDPAALDYVALARAPGTLVFFMGFAGLAEIAAGLIDHGRDPETPAAVVASGTTDDQRTVTATLAGIADASAELEPPALVVIGEVVALAPLLDARTPAALPFEATMQRATANSKSIRQNVLFARAFTR